MTFSINGIDCRPLVARGGLKVEKMKVTTKDSGRDTQDATMYLNVMAQKYKLTVTCRPLTTDQAAELLGALDNTWVDVVFTNPFTGGETSATMYSDDRPAAFMMNRGGTDYWEGIEFPLIEQ